MSEEGDGALGAAEQAELRHELRTPFNHLLGYTEMLLESAAEEGHTALVPGLQALHVAGKELLGVVNAGLAADRALRRGELAALAREVREYLPGLLRQVEALLALAEQGGQASARDDLGRIQRSIATLGGLMDERVLAQPALGGPPTPAVEVAEVGAPARQAPLPAGKVLVVDDNEINRDLLCRRLEREGVASVAARDGHEALELLGREAFDLILLDIVMPGLDGYEVLRQVKANPATRDVPVVMISALDELQSVVRCIEMGAEDYLPKPFDPVLLRARVGASLEKKQLRDRELEYLRGVAVLEESASAIETGTFAAERWTAWRGGPTSWAG
ncbi:MAG: response regulator [Gemmataceae bacterium]